MQLLYTSKFDCAELFGPCFSLLSAHIFAAFFSYFDIQCVFALLFIYLQLLLLFLVAVAMLVLEIMPVKLPISVANVKTSAFIIQILI